MKRYLPLTAGWSEKCRRVSGVFVLMLLLHCTSSVFAEDSRSQGGQSLLAELDIDLGSTPQTLGRSSSSVAPSRSTAVQGKSAAQSTARGKDGFFTGMDEWVDFATEGLLGLTEIMSDITQRIQDAGKPEWVIKEATQFEGFFDKAFLDRFKNLKDAATGFYRTVSKDNSELKAAPFDLSKNQVLGDQLQARLAQVKAAGYGTQGQMPVPNNAKEVEAVGGASSLGISAKAGGITGEEDAPVGKGTSRRAALLPQGPDSTITGLLYDKDLGNRFSSWMKSDGMRQLATLMLVDNATGVAVTNSIQQAALEGVLLNQAKQDLIQTASVYGGDVAKERLQRLDVCLEDHVRSLKDRSLAMKLCLSDSYLPHTDAFGSTLKELATKAKTSVSKTRYGSIDDGLSPTRYKNSERTPLNLLGNTPRGISLLGKDRLFNPDDYKHDPDLQDKVKGYYNIFYRVFGEQAFSQDKLASGGINVGNVSNESMTKFDPPLEPHPYDASRKVSPLKRYLLETEASLYQGLLFLEHERCLFENVEKRNAPEADGSYVDLWTKATSKNQELITALNFSGSNAFQTSESGGSGVGEKLFKLITSGDYFKSDGKKGRSVYGLNCALLEPTAEFGSYYKIEEALEYEASTSPVPPILAVVQGSALDFGGASQVRQVPKFFRSARAWVKLLALDHISTSRGLFRRQLETQNLDRDLIEQAANFMTESLNSSFGGGGENTGLPSFDQQVAAYKQLVMQELSEI